MNYLLITLDLNSKYIFRLSVHIITTATMFFVGNLQIKDVTSVFEISHSKQRVLELFKENLNTI